ncbi:hypothetical protein DOTSEDRAFT_74780 [Dothistroma septosporum NZE10]|uniref:Calponin-homology (CH) domain-containing protein n=1 Tax=Dothistroma septosporum (strain NZE10 / CBS 128990) TaxID=675120 RepID=N1PCK5_DOTSN|nr:hypothetical protein DOTSEDRAFT_74780 [Dothistroma septosporum NZE10]
MSRTSLATPCPTGSMGSLRLSITSQHSVSDDTTTNIEYTRALDPSLKASKPRRSSMFPSKATKRAPVTIFEDVVEDEQLVVADNPVKSQGKTMLCKPARKPVVAAATSNSTSMSNGTEQRVGGMREIGQGTSRISSVGNGWMGLGLGGGSGSGDAGGYQTWAGIGGALKKEARRRTIFMPSDDTTMLTIHPGAHDTNRLEDTFQLSKVNGSAAEESSEPKQKDILKPGRRPRKSLAVAPRRIPLQHSLENLNKEVETFDVCGENTGKENVPPMAAKMLDLKSFAVITRPAAVQDRAVPRSSVSQPIAASRKRQSVAPRTAVPVLAPVVSRPAVTRPSTAQRRQASKAAGTMASSRAPGTLSPHEISVNQSQAADNRMRHILEYPDRKKRIREHIAMKRLEMGTAKLSLYPVLLENLDQPELYEDNWLSQQEVALTEVVNGIFTAARDRPKPSSTGNLRKQFLDIYHQPEVSMLHRRLHASLLYGALSKPKTATALRDLSRDIGLRKRFVILWLDTYDEDSLRTAAETVVGRQVPRTLTQGSPKGVTKTEHLLDPHVDRRALTKFLETFFAAPVDVDPSEAQLSSSAEVVRWRKTMLRSLMLVWLLDNAKSSGIVGDCLFKRAAVAKSSTAVLHELSSMLMPSVGDITRALKQMDYDVQHVQDPLDEVTYQIDNLAVDLRDGVLLTHLVEVLLYGAKIETDRVDNEITITLPDTTTLASVYDDPDGLRNTRMLSRHLKMPAIGHAQKSFNVQVALSALECHDVHAANVVGNVTSEDIVIGHRERSLNLLWSLVSAFGLKHLIDWKALKADVQRHGVTALDESANEQNCPSNVEEVALLLGWASAYANQGELKKVTNLTTSFADGEAYISIIDGFSAYMPNHEHEAKRASSDGNTNLEARLEALGCSKAFTRQLASAVGNIPSRETTISNLAFLASRLLPLASRDQAAATIQRAFRQKRARIVASQRIALMRMARDCATVVHTRQRINAAATRIQRAWRAVVHARLQRMSTDVANFQTLARGWSTKRTTRVARSVVVAPQRVVDG